MSLISCRFIRIKRWLNRWCHLCLTNHSKYISFHFDLSIFVQTKRNIECNQWLCAVCCTQCVPLWTVRERARERTRALHSTTIWHINIPELSKCIEKCICIGWLVQLFVLWFARISLTQMYESHQQKIKSHLSLCFFIHSSSLHTTQLHNTFNS